MRNARRCLLLVLAVFLTACASVVTRPAGNSRQPTPDPSDGAAPAPVDSPASARPLSAQERFDRWSNRVLSAKQVKMRLESVASEAVSARFEGRWDVAIGNRVNIEVKGQFQGKPADLAMIGDGVELKRRNGGQSNVLSIPRETSRALLVGLLRMGAMHNLAGLFALKGPDHAEGLVDRWVTLARVREGALAGVPALEGAIPISHDILVSGQKSGECTLWFLPGAQFPRQRDCVIFFSTRQMKVRERYFDVVLVPVR